MAPYSRATSRPDSFRRARRAYRDRRVRRVRRETRAGRALQGEKGDKGDRGDKGDKGDQGAQGVQGQQGPAGSARAYGYVDVLTCASQPSCTVRKAKGITQAIRIGVGHYCVSAPGLHPNTDIAMATLDWYGTSGPEGNTSVETTPHACSFTHIDPNAFVVRTERQPVSNGVSGQAVDADDVSFYILIP